MRFVYLPLIVFIFFVMDNVNADIVLNEKSENMSFQVEKLADNLDIPWGLAFLNPDEIIFTEIRGTVRLLNLKTNQVSTIYTVRDVRDSGQGGLMDVALPPGYKQGDWIYFTYSKRQSGGAATALARAKHVGNTLSQWQDMLVTLSGSGGGRHFGSRISFDGRGHLFFSIGDRGYRPNGQDLKTHAGTILRLNLDGSIPDNNPFVGNGGALPEIWSYGHRNPQGIAFDYQNQRLWAIEHGPRGGDEINLILPGKNYGWAVVSHGKEYWGPISVGEGTEKEGMEPARKIYTPSIAPSSLILYSGKAFPGWQGNLLSGSLKLTHLNRIILDQNGIPTKEERLLVDLDERIRALVQGPQGLVYLSTDSGKILRIKPL